MRAELLKDIFEKVKKDKLSVDEAVAQLKYLDFEDVGIAKIDHHRLLRQGYPEVIYGASKSVEQICLIAQKLLEKGNNLLVTRASKEAFEAIKKLDSRAQYNECGKTIVVQKETLHVSTDEILIIAAGTSDLYVVEEAYETAKIFGNRVNKIVDVGVAGIHRLFSYIQEIQRAKVIIVVAGMEGALASVIGGLVDKPVIAVPTSVGYGSSFEGLAALLSMLNSCSSGVTVVNIDNVFGAAYAASVINQL